MLVAAIIFVLLACMSSKKFWKALFWIIAIIVAFI